MISFRVGIVLFGVAALTFLLWEPHLEGRNVHATVYQIYFNDPFLAYAYIASLPFFLGFVAGGVVFILLFGDKEDRPAGIFMSFLVTFAASVIAITAKVLGRKLQNALRRTDGGS